MIKLWDGWTIDTDEYQYILGKPVSTINKKGETENRTDKPSYHLSLSQAVQAFYKQQARECIGKDEYTLGGAIVALRGIEERVKTLLREAGEWDKHIYGEYRAKTLTSGRRRGRENQTTSA